MVLMEQVDIHDSISRVRVGRGSDAVLVAFQRDFAQRNDRPTNRVTDTHTVACLRETKNKGRY